MLNWATATESNNSRFAVQRSTDGTTWITIGSVATKAPNGNSNTALAYTFTDNSPLNGTNYYRLNQIDIDGTSTFSGIQSVAFTNVGVQVSVSPNPTSGTATTSGIVSGNKIRLIDMAGRVLTEQIVVDNTSSINLSTYAKGVYLVQVISNSTVTTTLKVVKQ